VRRGELLKNWDGLMTRAASFDVRHPLDFIRSKAEDLQKGSPRPEQDDTFLAAGDVTADDL
jgi:hypothetical protein